jgi:hypothetical protein
MSVLEKGAQPCRHHNILLVSAHSRWPLLLLLPGQMSWYDRGRELILDFFFVSPTARHKMKLLPFLNVIQPNGEGKT